VDCSSQGFLAHFLEQSGWVTLLFVGVPAAVYLGLLAIVVVAVGRRLREQGKRFLAVVAIALGVLVLALTIYESVALYFRSVPPGSGLERQASYDTYVSWAHASFVGLYVLVVGVAAWLARRVLHTWRWAAVVAGVMVAFMVLTFPFVDFLTECNVGVPLVSWGRQLC
jgi:hypothetical protein